MSFPEIIETIRIGLMKAGLGALALIVGGGVLFALWRTVRWPLVTTWRLLGWSGKAMVTILCAVCIFLAGGKNEGLRGPGNLSVTPEEIAQGYRLESVISNDAASYSKPTDGVEYARWSIRGGRETRFALDLGDFYFPFGTGTVHRFDVLSGGRIESLPRPSLATICAAREWASLVPGEGRFWWADAAVAGRPPYQGTQAVKLLTWEGVYAGRDRTGQYNAQIELRSGGDFTTRSNNVECVYRRVPPFDWDDDGLENSVDPDPLVAGPDAHGTNAEWYNTVCSNVFSAVTSVELPWQEGVNSNAYYFVDVVTEHGPAPIYFTGDRDSRLGNPVVVARAGETNHVPLLIGVSYAVTSTVPFTVSVPDEYMYPEVQTNEPCVATICWPLNFVFTESIGASNRVYTVTVEPYDPGGVLEWDSNVPMRGTPSDGDCGCVHCSGYSASFTCPSTCTCGAGCSARGTYHLENGLFSVEGGQCRCGFDDPPPDDPTSSQHMPDDPLSLTITFSKQAVVFDDECEIGMYDVKPKSSTRVRISVDAYGGTRGGELVFSSMNLGKLTPVDGSVTLPPSRTLAEQEAFHTTGVYEGAEASDAEGDVSISGTFTELVTGQQISDSNSLTVVRVEIKEVKRAPGNPYVHRRCYGIAEEVECKQFPSAPSVLWRTNGNGTFSLGITKIFCCPLTAERCQLYAECKSAPLPIILRVIEPERIGCDYAEFLPPTSDGRGCGMLLYLQLFPLSVSFSGLEIQEIPADLTNWQQWGSHSGYFDDYAFYQRWCHTTLWGAGVWHAVNEFNGIEFDESRIWTWPQPWSEGTLSWTIPYGWRLAGSTFNAPVGQINPPSYSVWTMSSNFIEKTKHSHTIGVSANGQMYLDGSLRNGNP